VIEEVDIVPPKKESKSPGRATAICHSDIHDIKGDCGPLPFIGGHESAGYIDEVGASVTSVKPGTLW
jgi:S-(hydroxymethyl)glutathione dehydrogenase/alcohol dehydrogenase